ncbi:MAG: radical SAM protein [Thermodesulfobacteriota bacterium]
MKITLIFPARDNDIARGMVSIPPAGITRLAALVPDDAEVKLVDMLSYDRVDYEEPADLVGITVRTPVASVAYEIADRFRARGVPVVLGGPHASAVPLDAARHADTVVVGEAETTWPRFLEDFRIGGAKRFYVCGPLKFDPGMESLHHEPAFPALTNAPIPKNGLLPRRRYIMDSILTTRGCPFDCSFCPVSILFGKKPRHRPVDEVVREVAGMKKRVYFNLDDNIFGIPGDEEYYLDLFKALAGLKKKKYWAGQAGLGVVDTEKGREILRRAVKSGLTLVSVGIESVSREGLIESDAARKMSNKGNKTPSVDTILEQIRALKEHGLFILGWFVIGWDSDREDQYQSTLEFADRAGIAPIIVNLYPMPGTRCYDDFLQAGRIKPGLDWEDFSLAGNNIVYHHPALSEAAMVTGARSAMQSAYSFTRMFKRAVDYTRHRPSPISFPLAMILQYRGKKNFPTD